MFPEKQPSRVIIKTKDGKEYSDYREYPKGDPREPMTMEDLHYKFEALSRGLISEARHQQIKDMIFNCEALRARDFMKKLAV